MSRPRIRTIKPEIWQDEAIGQLDPWARLLFVGLITMADDEGRLRALPTAILGHVFPYDDVTVARLARWTSAVAQAGLIAIYEHAGTPYIFITGWEKHQRVNRKTYSNLPAPSQNGHGPKHELSRSAQ